MKTRGAGRSIDGGDPRGSADLLFGSTTLVDLLILLIKSPDRRYYVNELIRLVGRYPRSVQLALERLEAAGVVRSEREANARFYRIAMDHPFCPALKALVEKIPNPSAALRLALAGVSGVRVAFIRPEEAGSSGLDLVVVGDAERARVEEAVAGAGRGVGQDVRVECFGVDDWLRQAKRERSYVRWLLEEQRTYVVGSDADLPV